jgi:micrococcal nuclease
VRVLWFATAITAALLSASACGTEFYSGRVTKVADGDTFTINSDGQKVRVRFCGIDSPERRQPGYAEASKELARIVAGREVRCIQVGGGTPCDGRSKATNRDRIVAQCFVGSEDIAMGMICSGHAKDWPVFSGGLCRLQAVTRRHCED